MPSPFPGMDPYLEGNLWTSFHQELATEIAHQLTPLLRPRYLALPERYYVPGVPDEVGIFPRSLYPDVGVVKVGKKAMRNADGTVLTAPTRMRVRVAQPVPQFHIEIRDRERRRLVTAIELLSPANKRGPGRKQYLRKRRRLLQSSAHLLEIDLHHQGKRVPMEDPYPPGAYFILLSRVKKRPWTEVWPVALNQPLPKVAVPLLKGDADVPLDVQDAVNQVYDQGGFDLAVNYQLPPDVTLSTEEEEWVEKCLREAGIGA